MSELDRLKDTTPAVSPISNSASRSRPEERQEVVVVHLRAILVNHLRHQQTTLYNHVEGFIGARDRELAISRIWERYFASPKRRAVLDDPETWEEIAELLTQIDPFGTVLKVEEDSESAERASVFDRELETVKEKVDEARYEDAPPPNTADAVRRCLGQVIPAVRRIRLSCQDGVRDTLRGLSETTAQIFEAFEMQNTAGDSSLVDASSVKPPTEDEGLRASPGTKASLDQSDNDSQAATDRRDIPMEDAS